MIAIVDYGVGNLFSLQSSLQYLGHTACVTNSEDALTKADRIILPGVGAFGDAMAKLRQSGMETAVCNLAKQGKPLLGICLGMQLLFEESTEFGHHKGLGLIPGKIEPLAGETHVTAKGYKVPHMGWNALQLKQPDSPLLKYTSEGDAVYYVHSFYAKECVANTVATSDYGVEVTAAVQNKNVYGTQFHPEKSGKTGLALLQAFAEVE